MNGMVHEVWDMTVGGWWITLCDVHFKDRHSECRYSVDVEGTSTEAGLTCLICLGRSRQ